MQRQIDPDFAAYVRARQHRMLRAAYLVCGDAHLAQDLLQEAFMKLAARWAKVGAENPDAFVRRILYRDAISAWRKVRRERLAGLDLPSTGADPHRGSADRVDLERALGCLTAKQRAVLVLRFFEDRSERDTADLLGVSIGTVKSQTHDAIARLRTLIPDLVDVERDLS